MNQQKAWKPDRPISKGAIAYHDAVSNAEYYTTILDELMRHVSTKIKQGDIVVDFGAGTGVSALRLLEHIKVNVKLLLVDNSAAWLGKAYQVFNLYPDV
jgi:ubiquinone/menaquinone biosynthesis C-methylase UbiE